MEVLKNTSRYISYSEGIIDNPINVDKYKKPFILSKLIYVL